MRQLTAKQKKVLDGYIEEDTGIMDWDNLPTKLIDLLESINDTEILWMETNRYLHDNQRRINYLKH